MRFVLFVLAAIILLQPAFVWAEQDFFVSKGIEGRNTIPRLAVNSETGDIFVVWTNRVGSSKNVAIYGRLFLRQEDGSYKAKDPFMISKARGWNASGQVVYVPWKNLYFVFWDSFDFTQGLISADILGRRVKANGKTRGGVKTIISDGYANNWARAVVMRELRDGDFKDVKRIMLTWTGFPTSPGDTGGGLKLIRIKNNMKAKGKPVLLQQVLIEAAPSATTPPVYSLNDLNYEVFSTAIIGYWSFFAVAYELNKPLIFGQAEAQYNGGFQAWRVNGPKASESDYVQGEVNPDIGGEAIFYDKAGNRYTGGFGRILGNEATKRYQWALSGARFENDDSEIGDLDGYLLVGSGGNIDGAYLPRNYDSCVTNRLNDLPVFRSGGPTGYAPLEGPIGDWHFPDGNVVKSQPIYRGDDPIYTFGDAETRFNHGGQLAWMEGDSVPGTQAVALAWQKSVSGSTTEIRLHIYETN